MADTTTNKAPAKRAAPKSATKASPAKKAAPKKTGAAAKPVDDSVPSGTGEAKSRFNAALEEAKAGAAALRAEAGNRAGDYREQAKSRGDELMNEAKVYSEKARSRAGELANEGKSAASDALATIGKAVGDTAVQIDERLGEQYGDYARSASRSLAETSAKLEAKSVDELGEDARAMVRKSPAVAVGIAAVAGFLLARLFRGSRD
ncbi:hypothetical protein [Qipengyuania sp. ASV99]|uniref:hypothetical protein n=1 Tax=Qipengyuania sp. ASV99 TaxID=3399681 RepID=UPI003A4C768B